MENDCNFNQKKSKTIHLNVWASQNCQSNQGDRGIEIESLYKDTKIRVNKTYFDAQKLAQKSKMGLRIKP